MEEITKPKIGTVIYKEIPGKAPQPVAYNGRQDVKFVAGLWRMQNPMPNKIIHARKFDWVLGEEIMSAKTGEPLTDFDGAIKYFHASRIEYNCWGPYLSPGWILACYMGEYYGYGANINDARAYATIEMCDKKYKQINALLQKTIGENTKS